MENYQLHPTGHFEFSNLKGLFPLFRESGNRPLNIRKQLNEVIVMQFAMSRTKVSNEKSKQKQALKVESSRQFASFEWI